MTIVIRPGRHLTGHKIHYVQVIPKEEQDGWKMPRSICSGLEAGNWMQRIPIYAQEAVTCKLCTRAIKKYESNPAYQIVRGK